MKKLFNLSGHRNETLDELGYEFPGVVQVNPEAPLNETAALYLGWLVTLGITSGDTVTVVLPGMSGLAGIAMAAIHGLTGTFPSVTTMVRQKDGSFKPSIDLDLQAFRNNVARTHRDSIVDLSIQRV